MVTPQAAEQKGVCQGCGRARNTNPRKEKNRSSPEINRLGRKCGGARSYSSRKGV